MKIYRKEEKFEPVCIELQSQEEVDAVYSIFNFSPITEAFSAHAMGEQLSSLHRKLEKFRTENYNTFHTMLDKYIERKR